MSELLPTLGPIFGLVVLGFAAGRMRVLDPPGVQGLVLFAFTFSIPALLIRSMADLDVPPQLDLRFLAAFYGATTIVWGLGFAAGRYVFGRDLAAQAIFALCASFSNLVLMGLPVVLAVLGDQAMLPMMLIIAFHSATVMPVTVLLVQAGRGSGDTGMVRLGRTLVDVVRNPIIVGIVIGLLLNVGSVPVPGVARGILDALGATAVPCALFALGASLSGYPLGGEVAPAVLLTVLKLCVHPILVWVLAVPVFGMEGLWVTVAVLLAAMPCAVNAYLFGARYEAAAQVAARTVLLTTAGSLLTVSIALTWL